MTSGEEARLSAGDRDDLLRAAFAGGWWVDAIEPATMDTMGGGSYRAWLATMTRGAATGGGMA